MDRILRIVPPSPLGEAQDELSEDERLVVALKARLPGAIDALLARHGSHLRRVLTRVLGAHDSEAADVLFHVMVALRSRGQGISDVLRELERREGIGGHDEKRARADHEQMP